MREELRRMDKQEARAWILRELEQAEDFQTHVDLAIGKDQNLSGWPSYRCFLLDLLYLVDPEAAAAKSRELVESSQSPDEWAVALRNVARADAEGEDAEWLRTKSAELLRNQTWRADPSSGYLEAFDVIVHSRNTSLAPELIQLCDDRDQKAVRHASFLTLDRLVQGNPEVVLPALAESASKHPESGLMLTNMMARADVRDTAQSQALEAYLLDELRTAEELRSFGGVFPNANFHISNNLLTRTPVLEGAVLAERDRAALETVTAWLADPRFARAHDALLIAQNRLKQFVKP